MMKRFITIPQPYVRVTNDNDALIPEMWANESVALLLENMVVANLVHRDFEDEVARFGETVHTRKPNAFTAKRKSKTDNIVLQNAVSTDIPVSLNQHLHTSFLLEDEDLSKSFKDLIDIYLVPAIQSIAQGADKILLCQAPRFLKRTDGETPGTLGTDMGVAAILATRKKLNDDKAPVTGRNFIITSRDETALLNLDKFTDADKVGDAGTAMREASLGQKYGFNFFMCQNTPDVTGTVDTQEAGAINNAAGYAKGTQTFTVDGFTIAAAAALGCWVVIAGDAIPRRITAATGTSITSITVDSPIKAAVANNAVVTIYGKAAVDLAAGYVNGYVKSIHLDGFTASPQVGQTISFLAGTPTGLETVYTIIDVENFSSGNVDVTLDRPLEAALTDDQVVAIGPPGGYNFAFLRGALAFVNRPLALPRAGTGALSAVASFGGVSIRITIGYDMDAQATKVTVDMLCGVAILDQALAECCVS